MPVLHVEYLRTLTYSKVISNLRLIQFDKTMKTFLFGLMLASAVMLQSCSDDQSSDSGTTEFMVRMTDAPGPFDAVMVDIQGVEVKSNQGTFLLNVNSGVYNLLDFVNGNDTLIASAGIPSGKVSQVRLILGPANSVVINGIGYPLQTPSAQQSGLKLNLHADLEPGVSYMLLLDFDAGKSIVENGNGGYILKPVIRVVEDALGGAIHGTAVPAAARPLVIAVTGTDSMTTHCDSATGEFLFTAVPAGSYDVSFYPDSPYVSQTVNGVVVTEGNLTEMGNIQF